MRSSFLRRSAASCLALGLLVRAGSSAAAGSGTLDTYRPAPTPEDDFQLSRPTDLGHLRVGVGLHLDYALNPLVWEDKLGDSSSERFAIVKHELVGTVGVSVGLWNRLVLYGGVPTVLAMTGHDRSTVTNLGPAGASGSGLGDANVGLRLRLLGELSSLFALGVQTTVTFPTSSGQYAGEDGVSALPLLTSEIRLGGGARLVILGGTLLRPSSVQANTNVEFGNELRFGTGISVPVWKDADPRTHFDLLAQINGASAFRDFFGRESTTLEVLGGARLSHASGIILAAGAGPGAARGIGSPDLRAVFTLGWLPSPAPPPPPVTTCANGPEDLDGFEDQDGCADPDNDDDHILDKDDKCPLEAENVNGWEDTDGCPEGIPDTDGDGLFDNKDRCPKEREDIDHFEDTDGCPDPDNDGDAVLDVNDACPMEPGVVDNRGCPDQDRDADTVVDRVDNCPDVPGLPANFGCPAKEKQAVRIAENRIEIMDTVYFQTDSDKILPKSFPLLDNVGAVVRAHPEIERIRVEGHTDDRGKRDHNMDLSRRRAASVMNYLVGKGVAKERLESEGYGPDRPVVPGAKTDADRAKNRRVAFQIVRPASAEAPKAGAEPSRTDGPVTP